ncbi:MAG: alpha/beta hydrolase [Planctomycetota bacterium]
MFWHTLKLIGIALLLFYILLYLLQNTMIFPATRDPSLKTPFWIKSVDFQSLDGTALHGWLALQKEPRHVPTILFFHGNAGNLSDREYLIHELANVCHWNVFMFDYRGYGRSQGNPSKQGVMQDAESALRTIQGLSEIDPNQIFYMGESLGGAIAIELAVKHPPRGLILRSTFARVKDMAPVPVFNFMLRSNFDSVALIPQVTCPVIFFHGDCDRVIPFKQGQYLYQTAQEPKEFHVLSGADHNDLEPPIYYETVRQFITKVLTTTK